MDQNKWWNRALIGSIVIHLLLLIWVAWVDPFAPKPVPQEEYLDLELVDISELPPVQSSAPETQTEEQAAEPEQQTAEPQPIMPVQKIVSPEEATASAPVVRPSASGTSTSTKTSSASGVSTGGIQSGAGAVDLSCGPVVVSRGTAVCKTPLRRTVKVKVRISIGTDGKVHKATVTSSSGNSGADKAALEAAYNYTFRPAQDRYGNAIASGGTIAVTVQPNR